MAVDCGILLERAALNLLDPLQRNGLIYLLYDATEYLEYRSNCMSVFPVLGGFTHHILFTFTSLLRPTRVSFWEDSTDVLEVFVPEIHQDLH